MFDDSGSVGPLQLDPGGQFDFDTGGTGIDSS